MNKRMFEAELILRNDSKENIAHLINKGYDSVLRKVNTGTFTQPEIAKIIERWDLTPEKAYNIFFSKEVS